MQAMGETGAARRWAIERGGGKELPQAIREKTLDENTTGTAPEEW